MAPAAGSLLEEGSRVQVEEKSRKLLEGELVEAHKVEIEEVFSPVDRSENFEALQSLEVEIELKKDHRQEAGQKDFAGGESSLVLKG